MRWFAATAAIAMLALSATAAAGVTLHVDDDAPAGGDGGTWETAFTHLQDALAAAGPGTGVTEIRIGAGMHRPDEGAAQLPGDRAATFTLVAFVTVRGGYAGFGADEPDLQDPVRFVTVLSGDLAGDDAPGFIGYDENSRHVVTVPGGTRGARLEGVTVEGGNADGDDTPEWAGGGVLVLDDGAPLIADCVLRANIASSRGGGISLGAGAIVDCLFEDNEAGRFGGGAYLASSLQRITVRTSVFRLNRVTSTFASGGGMTIFGNDREIVGCRFEENEALDGAGIYASYSAARVRSCTFVRNRSVGIAASGGGISGYNADLLVSGCAFIGNESSGLGGGIRNDLTDRAPTIEGCLFSGNTAAYGGAIASAMRTFVDLEITGCTFHRNLAFSSGGAVLNEFFPATITNCVMWFDLPAEVWDSASEPSDVTYSTVFGGFPGAGNLADDPQFVDAAGPDGTFGTEDDDLRLLPTSPAIDAGYSLTAGDCGVDLDGGVRRHDDPAVPDTGFGPAPLPDMGAYELGAPAADDCDGNGVADVCDADCNGSGLPDWCDLVDGVSADCNANLIPDECDIASGVSADCNADGIPDGCQLAGDPALDCNGNGRLDACDIASGDSDDCDGNGIPDECELPDGDCNDNGVLDACDIISGQSDDCDGNGVPDECELRDADCNGNGLLDACEIASGTSADCNANGLPDECEVVAQVDVESGTLSPFGAGSPQQLALTPARCARGDVTLDFAARADLGSFSERVDVAVNGVPVGFVFQEGATDCPAPPDVATLVVPEEVFNDALAGATTATFTLTPTDAVDPELCLGPSEISIRARYLGDGPNDADGDGVPDDCACPADIDRSGDVGLTDLLAVLAAWGPCSACPEDLDGDGSVGFTDLLTIFVEWGPCR